MKAKHNIPNWPKLQNTKRGGPERFGFSQVREIVRICI